MGIIIIIWVIQVYINNKYLYKINDINFIKKMFFISLLSTFIILIGTPSLIFWSNKLSSSNKINNSSTKEQ